MRIDAFLRQLAPVWKPHPGQLAFLQSTEKTRILACGRRWGKTAATAADIVFRLLQGSPERTLLVAPTGGQVMLLFDRVIDMLDRLRRAVLHQSERLIIRRSPFLRLEYEGSIVTARSGHRPASLRGDEADYLVVDEAAYVSERLVEETLMPMLATTAGRVTMLSTPNGYNHFYRWFMRGGKTGIWSRRAPSAENPFVNRTFLAEQKEYLPDSTYAVEYEAEFRDAQGQVFPEAHLTRAAAHPRPERPIGPFSIGIDWGETHDSTVVTVLTGTSEFAYLWDIHWFTRLPYDQQLLEIGPILSRYPHACIRCDATGVGRGPSDRLLAFAPTITVTEVLFTPKSKPEMVQALRNKLERDQIGLGNNPRLVEEMRRLMAYVGPSGNLRYEAQRGYHDDAVMSLALAIGGLTSGHPRIHHIV